MRMFLMTAVAAIFPLTTMMLANQALAVQDTPTTMNGVETVCTGVGSAKDDPRWPTYPIKIVLATSGGADLANAHITLNKGSKVLMQTECDAPWVLLKAPSGSYTATATLIGGSGQSHSANFTIGSGAQKEITITFARPMADAPAPAAPVGQ
ncbi:MAG TPA: hypothetical protein VNY75_00080 [Rhizomicrobium sp.]|nr:hypothetical protein [Rhizomicrobium sp.]